MITAQLDSVYNSNVQQWASALVTEIHTGSYKSQTTNWISCSSATQTLNKRYTIEDDVKAVLESRTSPANNIATLACPLVWATESNAYDCVSFF